LDLTGGNDGLKFIEKCLAVELPRHA
jgi:hypothetical protein